MAHGRFWAMLTDLTYLVAITPELTTPQFLLDTWHSRKDFAGCQAFYTLSDLGRTLAGHRLDQKMHRITIRPDFEKYQILSLGNLQT